MSKNIQWWIRNSKRALKSPHLLYSRVDYAVKRSAADVMYRFGRYRYPHRIIFLSGMALGATTWVKNLFARVPGIYTRPTPMPEEVRYNQDICDSAFKYVPKYGNTLFKTHLNPTKENVDCLFRNGVEKILVTHRDLRDVAISRYHRLVKFPKDPSDKMYMDYVSIGKKEALDHSIRIIKEKYEPWILGWYRVAEQYPGRIMFAKFEELKADTLGTFKRMLDFYGISLADDRIMDIVESSRGRKGFEKNMREAHVLPWGLSTNFRSGGIGYWRTELTEDQVDLCKELLGDTLVRLDYEKDLNWGYGPKTDYAKKE
ncbi:MAG: sulfotransferase domain-containing protein [Candidatus Omnitrophica bacterium]|nr:sulfotransferase domain-containing protein [Candidatus Omnitrophota bacterium]